MIRKMWWKICNINRDIKLVRRGFQELDKTGETPLEAYHAMRRLFVITNGRSNDFISKQIGQRQRTALVRPAKRQLFDTPEMDQAVKALHSHGYYIFKKKLPQQDLAELIRFGETQPCRALQPDDPNRETLFAYSEQKRQYDPKVASPKFNFDHTDILQNGSVQKLLMDPSLHRISSLFLGSDPIVDLIAMWWSQPCEAKAHSGAAQLYHFDLDRIKFLKFFFYLTDVTPQTGPHCYVAGSSKRKPKQVRRDGRIPDTEINLAYPQKDILELCGKAGTVMVVDTRGFHKGKPLTTDNRLLLQIEMANSLFGQTYKRIPFNDSWNEEFKTFAMANPNFLGLIDRIPDGF